MQWMLRSLMVAALVTGAPAAGQDTPQEALINLVQRWVEAVNSTHDAAAFDEFMAPNYLWHLPGEDVVGRDEVKRRFAAAFANMPDFRLTAEDIIPAGDRVIVRWSASGTRRDTGEVLRSATITLDRVINGKFVEGWEVVVPRPWSDAVNGGDSDQRVLELGLDTRSPGQPVLVLQSGGQTPLEEWGDWPLRIAKMAPVVGFDRPGIGLSRYDGEPPTPDRMALYLHALLKVIGVPPPYILVGHSWGAELIGRFAALHPEEVVGLVYLDPTPRGGPLLWYGTDDPEEIAAIKAQNQPDTAPPPPGKEGLSRLDTQLREPQSLFLRGADSWARACHSDDRDGRGALCLPRRS